MKNPVLVIKPEIVESLVIKPAERITIKPELVNFEEKWITLQGGQSDTTEGGGVHVKIDDSGKIVAGAKGLKGKNIGSLSGKKEKGKEKKVDVKGKVNIDKLSIQDMYDNLSAFGDDTMKAMRDFNIVEAVSEDNLVFELTGKFPHRLQGGSADLKKLQEADVSKELISHHNQLIKEGDSLRNVTEEIKSKIIDSIKKMENAAHENITKKYTKEYLIKKYPDSIKKHEKTSVDNIIDNNKYPFAKSYSDKEINEIFKNKDSLGEKKRKFAVRGIAKTINNMADKKLIKITYGDTDKEDLGIKPSE